jgi:hypothetical protein
MSTQEYRNEGVLISSVYDCNYDVEYGSIRWASDEPTDTNIRFQIRTAASKDELNSKRFKGPGGTEGTYYSTSGTEIWEGHNGQNWLQYKVLLNTMDIEKTPELFEVSFDYNNPPRFQNDDYEPSIGNINTDYNFSITYFDPNGDLPNFINLLIDDMDLPMVESNHDDIDVENGKSFYFMTKLTAGNHSYYFHSSDGNKEINSKIMYIEVDTGSIRRIEIIVDKTEMTTDEIVNFTALCYDEQSNLIDTSINWSTNGGGHIDVNGIFDPMTIGEWIVYVEAGGIKEEVNIIINEGALSRIIVTASDLIVTTDDTVSFEAMGYDSDGNLISISPLWGVSGGGRLFQNGEFQPDRPGIWIINASDRDVIGTLSLVVEIGALANIVVLPDNLEINLSERIHYQANGFDQDGNIMENILFNWKASGGGTIDVNGSFVGLIPGSYEITASHNGMSGFTIVTVNPPEQPDNTKRNDPEDQNDHLIWIAIISIIVLIMISAIILLFHRRILILFKSPGNSGN